MSHTSTRQYFDFLPFVPLLGIAAGIGLAFLLLKPGANQKVEVIPPEVQVEIQPLSQPTGMTSPTPAIQPSSGTAGVEIIPPEIQSPAPTNPVVESTTQTPIKPGQVPAQGQEGQMEEGSGVSGPGMSIRSSQDTSYSFHTVIGVVPVGTKVVVDGRNAVIKECQGSAGNWGRIKSPVSYDPGSDPEYYSDSPTGAKEGWIDLCGVQFLSKKMW